MIMTKNDPNILTRRSLFGSGIGLAAATASVPLLASEPTHAETGSKTLAMTAAAGASRTIAVEHITLICRRSFDEVHSSLVKNIPQLEPTLTKFLVEAKTGELLGSSPEKKERRHSQRPK